MVVLRAQLEVAEDDGDLGTGDDKDDEDEAEEAEEVVELVQPHAGQDEEQLDEHCAKGQNAPDQHTESWVHVPGLQHNHPANQDLSWLPLTCWAPSNGHEDSKSCHSTQSASEVLK